MATKDKLPDKEETKQEAVQEQEEIDEKQAKEEVQTVKPLDDAKIEKVKAELDDWKPVTALGKQVKAGEIEDINVIFDKGLLIRESKIVDTLLAEAETDLLLIGQSKGKFGGGQRRVFKQTQKKTQEGNKPKFATYAVIGNKNGFVGVGYGKSKETVPAREKALRNAKLNLIRIRRGCGSWQCGCKTPHSIPFTVKGKCSSCEIILRPAPKGTGLKAEKECQKVLALAGIKDIWSKASGKTTSKLNLIKACEAALRKLTSTKVQEKFNENLGVLTGNKD